MVGNTVRAREMRNVYKSAVGKIGRERSLR
jgi:hypothetical protein